MIHMINDQFCLVQILGQARGGAVELTKSQIVGGVEVYCHAVHCSWAAHTASNEEDLTGLGVAQNLSDRRISEGVRGAADVQGLDV